MNARSSQPVKRAPRRMGAGHAAGAGRSGLVRAVRAAANRMGLDDDDRHAVQKQVTGKASLSDMSAGEIGRLLDHLNKGWKKPDTPRPHVGKIKALWWSLYWLGLIHEASDAALDAFVKRQTGVERIQFLDFRKAPSVIEALKSWLSREGVSWSSEADVADHVARGAAGYTLALADRWSVLHALKSRVKMAGILHTPELWIVKVVGWEECAPWHSRTATELDAAIRALGKYYRAELAKAEQKP